MGFFQRWGKRKWIHKRTTMTNKKNLIFQLLPLLVNHWKCPFSIYFLIWGGQERNYDIALNKLGKTGLSFRNRSSIVRNYYYFTILYFGDTLKSLVSTSRIIVFINETCKTYRTFHNPNCYSWNWKKRRA